MKFKEEKRKKETEDNVRVVKMISVDDIVPNPAQPRRFFTDEAILRLADSIRVHGIIQPLCVRKSDSAVGIYSVVTL